MAALIDEARAARKDASRLGTQTAGLKLSCQARVVITQTALATAEHVTLSIEPLPSPWSTLD